MADPDSPPVEAPAEPSPGELSPAAEAADEPRDLGDISDVDFNQPSVAPKRGSLMGAAGWLAAIVSSVVFLAFYLFAHSPAVSKMEEATLLVNEMRQANASLDEEVSQLEGSKEELMATREKLAQELEQKQQEIDALQATQDELSAKLSKEIEKGTVAIAQREGQLVVDMSDQILFDSGEAELNEKGQAVLRQMGETFRKLDDKIIQVGGHTDSIPISGKLIETFPTNWELSSARATHVVRFLHEELQVPGKRLIAAGFSQYRPVAKNSTKSGRRRNRRLEMVLMAVPKADKGRRKK